MARKSPPGCRRVNLSLPEVLLAEMDRRVPRLGRSRFLSYCARARLAGSPEERARWEKLVRKLLNE